MTADRRVPVEKQLLVDGVRASTAGIDVDRPDGLRVTGRVTVDDIGSYAVNGCLVDGAGNELGEHQTTAAERGQPKTTAHQLAAFVRELEALVSDKLSEQTRATLIDAAHGRGGR